MRHVNDNEEAHIVSVHRVPGTAPSGPRVWMQRIALLRPRQGQDALVITVLDALQLPTEPKQHSGGFDRGSWLGCLESSWVC